MSNSDPREEVVVVLSTVPDAAAGEKLARALLEERVIACANLVPGVRSLFWWEGAVQEEHEMLLLMKTRTDLKEAVLQRAFELHPYDVPELLVMPTGTGLDAYCRWVVDATSEVDR